MAHAERKLLHSRKEVLPGEGAAFNPWAKALRQPPRARKFISMSSAPPTTVDERRSFIGSSCGLTCSPCRVNESVQNPPTRLPMPISPYIKTVREKIGHDLLTLTAVSISVFDTQERLLFGKDADTGLWMLPGGAIDPNEHPADAALRECFEETGVVVELDGLVGVFGGPEFLVQYPNDDIAYYTTIAFRAHAVSGSALPRDGEMSELRYFGHSECESAALSPSSWVIAERSFARSALPYFKPPTLPLAGMAT